MEIRADIQFKDGKKKQYEAVSGLKKKWCLSEYRDRCGIGSERLFETKEEALAIAEDMWSRMDDRDKRSYSDDPAGCFWVGLVWAFYDEIEGEWVRTDGTYPGYCDPIEIVKDFVAMEGRNE